jgi:hypothetical protein
LVQIRRAGVGLPYELRQRGFIADAGIVEGQRHRKYPVAGDDVSGSGGDNAGAGEHERSGDTETHEIDHERISPVRLQPRTAFCGAGEWRNQAAVAGGARGCSGGARGGAR